MRFRLKTHTFFYPFSPSVHTNTIENGGFQKRSLEWRFLKSKVQRLCVDGQKTEVFESGGSASLCGRAKTEVFKNDYVTGIGGG